MLSILNRSLPWTITSLGNKFCLKKRSTLIRALDNRFYVKFMQLEIGLLGTVSEHMETLLSGVTETSLMSQTGIGKVKLGSTFTTFTDQSKTKMK